MFEDVPTGPFRIVALDDVRGFVASKSAELVVHGTGTVVNGCVDGECQILFEDEAVGTITGEVRLASGDPAPGALVRAGGLETITADDGTFQIDGVAAGSHSVRSDFGPGRNASCARPSRSRHDDPRRSDASGRGDRRRDALGHRRHTTRGTDGGPRDERLCGIPADNGRVRSRDVRRRADSGRLLQSASGCRHRDGPSGRFDGTGDAASIALRFGGYGTVTGRVVDDAGDPVHGADVVLGARVPNQQFLRVRAPVARPAAQDGPRRNLPLREAARRPHRGFCFERLPAHSGEGLGPPRVRR